MVHYEGKKKKDAWGAIVWFALAYSLVAVAISGWLTSYSSSSSSLGSRPRVTKLPERNILRSRDEFCRAAPSTQGLKIFFFSCECSSHVPVGPFHILWEIETLCRGGGDGWIIDRLPGSHFCFNHRLYGQKPFTSSPSGFSDWKQRMSRCRGVWIWTATLKIPCTLDLLQGVELELKGSMQKKELLAQGLKMSTVCRTYFSTEVRSWNFKPLLSCFSFTKLELEMFDPFLEEHLKSQRIILIKKATEVSFHISPKLTMNL